MANQHSSPWSPADIDLAKRVLATSHTLSEAAAVLSVHLGRTITDSALEGAFRRREGEPSAGSFLARSTAPPPIETHSPPPQQPPPESPPDPVQERIDRDAAKRERTSQENLINELREARERQRFLDELSASSGPPRIIRREKTSGMREMTAVVLASDWHVEEKVDPEAIAYRNKYNLEIADQRITRFFNSIAWNIEHHRASGRIAIRDLVLWLGGDLMSGYIHEELQESNELSPTETILWLLPRLHGGLRMLQETLDLASITVPCSYGNHGRTTKKSRISTGPQNSYEWLMYHNLARELASEPTIRFEITKSAHQYVETYDRTIHFHHGDDLNYQGGVGGLGIPLLKAAPVWNDVRRADIHCIGHWHQLRDYGVAVINGSLIGYGPYSQRIRAPFEAPQQAMFYMDSARGKSMLTSLWVGENETKTRAA